VHSTIGAFGYNSTVYDASNLSWKLGLCINGAADPAVLLPTYDIERRLFSNRVIRYSGALLRFICRIEDPLPELRGVDEKLEVHQIALPNPKADNGEAGRWLGSFFHDAPPILMSGLGFPLTNTILSPSQSISPRPVQVANGVRAPNPRVALRKDSASYLYDALQGSGSRFHLLVFVSDLQGSVRQKIVQLGTDGFGPRGFYQRYGGCNRFKVTVVVKAMPHNVAKLMAGSDLEQLRNVAQVVYDDRAPDEDAHYSYAVNHAKGAVVVIRPDLVVGTSAWPDQTTALDAYFGSFLLEI
jgi:phenol 2-monooxygenase